METMRPNTVFNDYFISSIVENMQEAVLLYDTNGSLLFFNRAAEKLGLTNLLENRLCYLEEQALVPEEQWPARLLLNGEQVHGAYWLKPKKGPVHILQIDGFPIYKEDSGLAGGLVVSHDITERKWAEQRLEMSEQRYKSLFEYHPDIVCWFDLKGNLIKANAAIEGVSGLTRKEMEGKQLLETVEPSFRRRTVLHFFRAARGKPQHFEVQARGRREPLIDLQVTLIPMVTSGRITGIYAIVQDISQRKAAERLVHTLAYQDPLTGLANRQFFNEQLRFCIEEAEKTDSSAVVLFIDLDRFKWINDTLGHSAGDRLVTLIAQRIKSCIGEQDILARIGGDEFTLLMPGARRMQAERMAAVIIDALSAPFSLDGNEYYITASIGASVYPNDGLTAEALMKNADAAMYRAKEQGKNAFRLYRSEMNIRMHRKLIMDKELRRALEAEELTLQYQPQWDLQEGRIVGMEALLRWKHPVSGYISPAEFIPLAEETGFIVPMGEWVLETACSQYREWQKAGMPPIRLAVNLSVRQFQDGNLLRMVDRVLQRTGIHPGHLELEVTESIAAIHVDFIKGRLNELKALGVQIAIDDFGTGYSSLSYLKRFPIDRLKIDQSFIREMISDEADYSIVKAIIAMARSLRLEVIAEGVEEQSQANRLRELGCMEIQGYFFSRPLSIEDMGRLLFPTDL
ncbi:sensor domain-containing protein [Paenibacillus turpanensis]|uniref:sensor domain-containing protein n=1 Tax=Paenibacillus turpanensis TaxID=2689078 RepID=UPI00140DF826|nr:bifunctional diguanylate cyclase/phosphodiesterase [Paenibacillus turpanensis]